jgi:hypothetical protein
MWLWVSIPTIIILFRLSMHYWDRYALKKMTYTRYFDPPRVTVGDKSTVLTTIVNKKIIPLPWIKVTTLMPIEFQFENAITTHVKQVEKYEHTIVTSLLFYEQLKRSDGFICTKRGFYQVDSYEIEAGDFFGFSVAKHCVNEKMILWVHPQIKSLRTLIREHRSFQGDVSVKRWINPDPILIMGHRAYEQSDPFHMIDWKTTAKMGSLYIKKQDFTADYSMMLFLDVQTSEVHWQQIDKEAIEDGILIATAIIDDAIKSGFPTGLMANTLARDAKRIMHCPIGQSPNHRLKLMDTLAMVGYHRSDPMEKVLHDAMRTYSQNTTFVVITSHLSKSLYEQINRLATYGYSVKLIAIGNDFHQKKYHHRVTLYTSNRVLNLEVSHEFH